MTRIADSIKLGVGQVVTLRSKASATYLHQATVRARQGDTVWIDYGDGKKLAVWFSDFEWYSA